MFKLVKLFTLTTTLFLFNFFSCFGQNINLDLTFSAVDSIKYIKLDSVKVMNRMFGGNQATIYWPDTTISFKLNSGDTLLYIGYSTIYPVGERDLEQSTKEFRLFDNFPNPVADRCLISTELPDKGLLYLDLYNIHGQRIEAKSFNLEQGIHRFNMIPGTEGILFLTARWLNGIQTVKIVSQTNNRHRRSVLEYLGTSSAIHCKPKIAMSNFMQESGFLDAPLTNKSYIFQFATNIPCLGSPTIIHGGKIYQTIQIYSQCWLKENLNYGTMIPGTQNMSDNGIIEKYCYDDDTNNCRIYGGLYQRDEAVQYNFQYGTQGICPQGWHIPTDEEWKVLEGSVDEQFLIGDIVWENHGYRGSNVGANLKTTSGWNNNGNGTDKHGFSGLPAGSRIPGFFFYGFGNDGLWWTSSQDILSMGYYRLLDNINNGIHRGPNNPDQGYSVRCLRND